MPSANPHWPDASTHASTKNPKKKCEISPGCAGESYGSRYPPFPCPRLQLALSKVPSHLPSHPLSARSADSGMHPACSQQGIRDHLLCEWSATPSATPSASTSGCVGGTWLSEHHVTSPAETVTSQFSNLSRSPLLGRVGVEAMRNQYYLPLIFSSSRPRYQRLECNACHKS